MDYKAINRKQWNERTKVHVNSEFYDTPTFISGRNSLNSIELDLLGDVKGKKILHLQCHFGQDTLSLARMGASVTGVDISDEAILHAQKLSATINVEATFIRSDIYDLPSVLDDSFDIVFASYGTIGWLPDINRWAQVVKHYLKPGGRLVFVEFHPVIWMFSYDFKLVEFGYFNLEPIIEVHEETYTDGGENLNTESVSWNHTLSDVFNALKNNDISMNNFQEFDYSPYNCFQNTVEVAPKKFMIKTLEKKLPMVYAIVGKKQ